MATDRITIKIPHIEEAAADYESMFGLFHQSRVSSADVVFDFSSCDFLRQNAVAFLGGLIRLIQAEKRNVFIKWESIQTSVGENLKNNGFEATFLGKRAEPLLGNTLIPYRGYQRLEKASIIDYLENLWLGRGWIHISPGLKAGIVGRVWEIYANAFEHSQSPVGVHCCGQYYPDLKELSLTVVDFGIGVPKNVRDFAGEPTYRADHALEWAFQRGMTTRPGMGRGLGLDLLKGFVTLNKGTVEMFSHDAHAYISGTKEDYSIAPVHFAGTLLNITLKCDDRYYLLATEAKEPTLYQTRTSGQ